VISEEQARGNVAEQLAMSDDEVRGIVAKMKRQGFDIRIWRIAERMSDARRQRNT